MKNWRNTNFIAFSYRSNIFLTLIMACCKLPEIMSPVGTVFCMIWWKLILLAAYSAIVVALHREVKEVRTYSIPKTFQVMDVIGVVTGLLLVFRTNTAYERFWEGQKLWSEMVSNIRIFTRTIWVMVHEKNDPKVLLGKISALNLLVAFAYATKHYLREEYSREEIDLKGFVQHLPSFSTPSSNEPLEGQEESDDEVQAHEKRKRRKSKVSKELRDTRKAEAMIERAKESKGKHVHMLTPTETCEVLESTDLTTSNIPLEISIFLTAYVVYLKEHNLIDSPTTRVVDTAIGNMVKCLTGFERIRRTPIPKSYSVHLTHIAWIVVLCLPFQLAEELHWYTIGVTLLAGFAFLGILSIGNEIENPFGYKFNNLHLDDFCHVVHKEITAIMATQVGTVEGWVLSKKSCPIVTHPDLSADKLANMECDEINMILSKGKGFKITAKSAHSNLSQNTRKTKETDEDV